MRTEAFKRMLRLRKEIATHEVALFALKEQLLDAERQVQAEQGKCACWLPLGDRNCACAYRHKAALSGGAPTPAARAPTAPLG